MKKIVFVVIFAVISVFSGCAGKSGESVGEVSGGLVSGSVVEIREKMFIQQCTDIFTNPDDYKGKIIRLEGIYSTFYDVEGTQVHYIYRNTPGCCGNDGQTGFEFVINSGEEFTENDWLEIEGTIEVTEEGPFYNDVILNVSKIVLKQDRGAEFVKT